MMVEKNGIRVVKEWYKKGQLNRKKNKPAVVKGDYKAWYKYGVKVR